MNDGEAAWPLLLRVMHWISAVLIAGTLCLGFYMVQMAADPGRRFELTQTHKSIGVLIFALAMARLCVRAATGRPTPEPASPPVLAAAKAAHVALYVLLLLMPLSGWLMTTTTPVRVPTMVFSLFPLPYPLQPNMAAYRIIHAVHVTLAIALAILIVFHVAAALLHALWWRDRTLTRMIRKPRAAA
jgi:cytochrome b561